MRHFLITSFPALSVLAAASLSPRANAADAMPVLVELFTSEGCSSCPPADELLAQLARTQPVTGVEIIPLELHVDYWNQLGWADPFSSPDYSERQRGYARPLGQMNVYTPQMIIDGTHGFVADSAEARSHIRTAAQRNKIPLALSVEGTDDLTVTARLDALPPDDVESDVWLALTEEGLSTQVPRGENAGVTVRHAAVVRRVARLGTARAGSQSAHWAVPAAWNRKHLRVVAWVERRGDHHVRGLAARTLR